MSTVIIACKTIETELLTAMAQENCNYPILWLESGLHNWPDRLRTHMQKLLDTCQEYDTVLLAMSFCGNSVVGLQTHDFQLVIPRCDDCITLLLGAERRRELPNAYFLTEGWLAGERNLYREYQDCTQKYGTKRGNKIFSAMLQHYRYLALVDAHCADQQALKKRVQSIAQELGLEYLSLEGSLQHLRRLLRPGWEKQEFLIVPENSIITTTMCLHRQ